MFVAMIKATDLYGEEGLGDPLIEEFEHARERRPALDGFIASGDDLALDAVVRGPGDVKKQAYGPPRR